MVWFIVVGAFVVLLAVAAVVDSRSRRIRGHALTMRLPSRMDRRAEARMARRAVHGSYEKYRARRPGEDVPRAD
ncbi:hypothetical protein [Kutzneria sp. CA-103260]|uniref:hypothetical protein n=1 Tax=Kutzneria sp. CA-103260 TaxID=2802641 RepID=UPI001BA97F34|nr:hypothetical protein [Kutzneria sp. CA-103260]QUQ63954.1 hypothetical protein JJ691_16710 [Kutzneria sp. CA-103260]